MKEYKFPLRRPNGGDCGLIEDYLDILQSSIYSNGKFFRKFVPSFFQNSEEKKSSWRKATQHMEEILSDLDIKIDTSNGFEDILVLKAYNDVQARTKFDSFFTSIYEVSSRYK